ncbi:hypothetical protein KEJ18_06800 [Candidatus Bathyarchaeota archaeon]|nr:hypothetical protein [Candidatus Bathyarchaeota archaeon]
MSEKSCRQEHRHCTGVLCIVLVVGLFGIMMNYASVINEKDNIITSLNSEISNYQDQVADLQDQVTNLQETNTILRNLVNALNRITNITGLGTVEISWYNAYFTSNRTKLGMIVTVVNNSSVQAENVSLVINVLFYNFVPHNNTFEYVERSMNFTIEIKRLDLGEWYVLQKFIDAPEGEGWHFSVDFTLYVNGVETDHKSFGCY